MILLSHSNSSFAESPFFKRKKLPELEIIEPYSCMCVGVRESELLALITWIIYSCHPSLAALNFQNRKVLLEIIVRLKGTVASELTFQYLEEKWLSLTFPCDGCAAPAWDGDRESGPQGVRGLSPHSDAPTLPSALRWLACPLRLSHKHLRPGLWASPDSTQPLSLAVSVGQQTAPGHQGSWLSVPSMGRDLRHRHSTGPGRRVQKDVLALTLPGVRKGSFSSCGLSETNATAQPDSEPQEGMRLCSDEIQPLDDTKR